ncbi:hypothetical protein HOLleu_11443 [Holothuria leucospilota]|uniref:Uncharacterized protein n=1 Tax=Holothuria leucospilota TaxID=206669 RepID=A0A9Q1CGA0_HOLLE|nr:hypothetical protein HOLleu_11443 [Holothuria leucospilota]
MALWSLYLPFLENVALCFGFVTLNELLTDSAFWVDVWKRVDHSLWLHTRASSVLRILTLSASEIDRRPLAARGMNGNRRRHNGETPGDSLDQFDMVLGVVVSIFELAMPFVTT